MTDQLPTEPDDIDQMFSAYFRQQLPKSWPTFQPTASAAPSGNRPASSANRSRATLAIAAVALLAFALMLTSGFRPAPTGTSPSHQPDLLGGAEADGSKMKHLLDRADDAPQKGSPKN